MASLLKAGEYCGTSWLGGTLATLPLSPHAFDGASRVLVRKEDWKKTVDQMNDNYAAAERCRVAALGEAVDKDGIGGVGWMARNPPSARQRLSAAQTC